MVESVTETVSATPVVAAPSKKKKTPSKGKSTAKKIATHPATALMVTNAIKTLNERGGSSLQAIKKFISGTYKLDAEKLAPFVKKYLKSAVDKGALLRTKGKGASGSFKLASKVEPKKKTNLPKKKSVVGKNEKSADAKPKKVTASPKKSSAKKAAKPKVAPKPKSTTPKKALSKVKKTKATPVKKPKSPKPKKTVAKKSKKVIAKK